jgi:hypothetical protein
MTGPRPVIPAVASLPHAHSPEGPDGLIGPLAGMTWPTQARAGAVVT